ncbi:hypothetical protein KC852_02200 [Candidatus Nomurabacteria bacterium]|nr:hypothetical protein [Candidatus Nomurabacteria bacterium]
MQIEFQNIKKIYFLGIGGIGVASQVSDDELEEALYIFDTKRGKSVHSKKEFLSGHQRLYKIVPEKCWVNCFDKTKSPADWREKIKLTN